MGSRGNYCAGTALAIVFVAGALVYAGCSGSGEPFCGNGTVDLGEQCDPEDPATRQNCNRSTCQPNSTVGIGLQCFQDGRSGCVPDPARGIQCVACQNQGGQQCYQNGQQGCVPNQPVGTQCFPCQNQGGQQCYQNGQRGCVPNQPVGTQCIPCQNQSGQQCFPLTRTKGCNPARQPCVSCI